LEIWKKINIFVKIGNMNEATREQIIHIQTRVIFEWFLKNIPEFGRISDAASDKIQRMFDIVNEKKDDD
jgi:hypothetical protein